MPGLPIDMPEDPTLHLPRILCLHGGGTNARIFRAQCRLLEAKLKSEFRLCFADAPFLSQAGPDVVAVYKNFGPFRRWLRWRQDQPEIDAAAAVRNRSAHRLWAPLWEIFLPFLEQLEYLSNRGVLGI